MYSFLFFAGFVCSYSLLIRNSHLMASPVFVFAKSGKPALLGPRPVSQPGAHRRRERPARCSHAGRSLATRPQREPGRRNLSTCLINGGAETAVQTGLRQPHKEEAPRPLPPSIDLGPLWLGQRGRGRRLAGTWPFSLGGEGPGGPPPRQPTPPFPLPRAPGLRSGGVHVPSGALGGAQGGVGPGQGGSCIPEAWSLPVGPATQIQPPEDPPVCPGSLFYPPGYRQDLQSLYFILFFVY